MSKRNGSNSLLCVAVGMLLGQLVQIAIPDRKNLSWSSICTTFALYFIGYLFASLVDWAENRYGKNKGDSSR